MNEDLQDVGMKALVWVVHNYPDASIYHRVAFLNSVTYLVNGKREGLGRPSLRERLVVWKLDQHKTLPKPGEWELETACKYAAEYCFSPAEEYISILGEIAVHEYTYNDDPDDIKAIRD